MQKNGLRLAELQREVSNTGQETKRASNYWGTLLFSNTNTPNNQILTALASHTKACVN